jgi:hypothetical protein
MVKKEFIYNFPRIISNHLIIKIPPIPRKNSTERFQEELINERMRDFEVIWSMNKEIYGFFKQKHLNKELENIL